MGFQNGFDFKIAKHNLIQRHAKTQTQDNHNTEGKIETVENARHNIKEIRTQKMRLDDIIITLCRATSSNNVFIKQMMERCRNKDAIRLKMHCEFLTHSK